MTPISFKRHHFPPMIIQHSVWLYARLTLSFRDVEELLAERGIDVSNETVRRWFLKFGQMIARNLRSSRPRASARWHLDEMVLDILFLDNHGITVGGESVAVAFDDLYYLERACRQQILAQSTGLPLKLIEVLSV